MTTFPIEISTTIPEATPVDPGLLSATDKAKLDGIPPGGGSGPHTHPIADVIDLQAALDSKADAAATAAALLGKSDVGHLHAIAHVGGLQAALDDKAAAAHTHNISDVTDLQSTLDGKAAVVHTHVAADVVNLVPMVLGDTQIDANGKPLASVGENGQGAMTWLTPTTAIMLWSKVSGDWVFLRNF